MSLVLVQFDKDGVAIHKETKEPTLCVAIARRDLHNRITIEPGQYRKSLTMEELEGILFLKRRLAKMLRRR